MCRNSVKKVCNGKKSDIEKNDSLNYWKISNDANKHYVDIMNTKSDLSESEYNSVSKMRMSYMNAEMSEISGVLNYFAVRNFELVWTLCKKFWYW